MSNLTQYSETLTLRNNYDILFRLYRQGRFESETLELKGMKYIYLEGENAPESHTDQTGLPPIAYAADDLYKRARLLYGNFNYRRNQDKDINLVWQALTLSYEINDVYLRVEKDHADLFSQLAGKIASTDKKKPMDIANDLAAHIDAELNKYSSLLRDSNQERVKYKKLLVLSALAGVNAILRDIKDPQKASHRKSQRAKAKEAADYATHLLAYIKYKLPEEHTTIPNSHQPGAYMPARESYGLLGLCYFERGRALILLGDHHTEAEQSFLLSTEAYAERLIQKERFWQEEVERINRELKKINNDSMIPPEKKAKESERLEKEKKIETHKYNDRKSVTLRRMALTTAIGSCFLAFTRSQLTRALEGATLARAVLRENSSIVLRSYVDMLYWQIQRAKHSDDRNVLAQAKTSLEKCYDVFSKLTPNRHYQHRCGLEIALVCFYLAKTDSDDKATYYEEAEKKLALAEKYFSDEDKGVRHPQLHSELYVLKSHLLRSHPLKLLDKLGEALLAAQTACKHAINLNQYTCEAFLAVAAAHASLAKQHYSIWSSSKDNENLIKYQEHVRQARYYISLALSANIDNNVRVKAVSYLRLAKLCLIEPDEKHSEAQHHFMNWLNISGLVEHQFCHQHATDVEEMLKDRPRKLVVDFASKLNNDFWHNEVEALFIDTCLNRVADTIRSDKNLLKDKTAHLNTIVRFLGDVNRSEGLKFRPYDYIRENKLLERLGLKLGIDYSDISAKENLHQFKNRSKKKKFGKRARNQ